MNFGIAPLSTCAATLLYKLLKVPAEEAGNIMGDYLLDYRLANLERIYEKHRKILEGEDLSDISLRPVSPKLGIPLLEAASLESDDDLQEVWARLLTNAANANFKREISPAFVAILRTLSPIEASILRMFYEALCQNDAWDSSQYNCTKLKFNNTYLMERFKVDEIEVKASLLNLERCQLITTFHEVGAVSIAGQPSVHKGKPALTALGFLLINACIADSRAELSSTSND